jgi:hypothetical protein
VTSQNPGRAPVGFGAAGDKPEVLAPGVFVRRAFLAPADLMRLLNIADRLAPSLKPSESLGLLGRGGTGQVRSDGVAARAALDEMRQLLAPATLRWAQACGFWFPRPPHLQIFPVRMSGDPATPAYQEPHTDSHPSLAGAPVCTSVFYARLKGAVGGELAVAATGSEGADDHFNVTPTPNTIVTFAGERVHWVLPLTAGERLSFVVNFY